MTAADTQLLITASTPIIVAICGAITAVYAAKAHGAAIAGLAQGKDNRQAIADVKDTVDGSAHTLAEASASSKAANEAVIRTLAEKTLTQKPPLEGP